MEKHAVLASVGTDGDIVPFVGLGMVLHARGWRVTLAAHQHHQTVAKRLGFDFAELVTKQETQELYEQADMWHPLKSGFVMARWGTRLIARQHETLARLANGNHTVLIANPGVVAARIVHDHQSTPLASLALQPWIIPSTHVPPIMMGGMGLPRWAPGPIKQLHVHLINKVGDLLVGPKVNQVRRSIGLRPIRRIFEWWHSPQLVLGMFPDWFAQIQPDWPKQIRLVGFPMSDGQSDFALPPAILEFCRGGTPPVVFTFGTGMMHAKELFLAALDACRAIGTRAIFPTKFREQLPERLPEFARHCEFAPFQALFPECSAIVHHGGIGTTAKALASGVPQLVLPFAFDQLDNASRVKRLGCGTWLKADRRSATQIAEALTDFIKRDAQQRAKEIAKRFQGINALEDAADHIERLLG